LSEDRHKLVEQKTRLLNQLRANLKSYYPAAIGLFSSLEVKMSLSFLSQFPTPQDAKTLAVDIHRITPLCEQGQQIRRSSKSVPANGKTKSSVASCIAEGYGRRRYKNQFILSLTYAIASLDETKCHLEILCETFSLDENLFSPLYTQAEELGRRLYRFRESVIRQHHSEPTSDENRLE